MSDTIVDETVQAVWDHLLATGNPPMLKDLVFRLKLGSVSAVQWRIEKCKAAGLLQPSHGRQQSIQPTAWAEIKDRIPEVLAIVAAVAGNRITAETRRKSAEIMDIVARRRAV